MYQYLAEAGAASALQSLYYAGGALGLVITVSTLGRRIGPAARRRVHRWDRMDELLGDPDASPPRPGVIEHIAALRDELAEVRGEQEGVAKMARELVPNSGSSWRDAYERDQGHQQAVNAAIAEKLGITLPPAPPRAPKSADH